MMNFKKEFLKEINKLYPDGLEWGLVGILTKDQRVYTLSHDSKILSGIFEIFCEPIVTKIANNHLLKLKKTAQNQYPDFTLYNDNKQYSKIAIDVKSTYRQYNRNGTIKKFGFTLGSYKSYLRDPQGKKGILYPYKEYCKHWIIGFVYDRNQECGNTEINKIIEASTLQTPFLNIDFFVQEKYKVAGQTTGSGNTTNIGSIKSNNINHFDSGKMGFRNTAEFETYWGNYNR